MTSPNRLQFEESLSAQLDAESPQDLSLATAAADDAQREQLLNRWKLLGECLRELPHGGAGDLNQRVLREIREEVSARTTPHVPPQSTPARPAAARGFALVATLAVACLLLVPLTSDLLSPNPSSDRIAEGVSADTRDWEIIVLTVPDDGHNGVPESVLRTVIGHGLQIRRLGEQSTGDIDHPDILMASAGVSQQLREVLDSEIASLQAELNPDRIGDLDREQMLARFAESMHTPTKSDEYFGEMSLVVPDDGSIVVQALPSGRALEELIVADSSGESANDLPGTTGTSARSSATTARIAEYLTKGNGKPVLVVLVRRKVTAPDLQGHSEFWRNRWRGV